jgi:hypothetical protein
LRHRFGEDAATTADINDIFACQRTALINPFQTQRVDFM